MATTTNSNRYATKTQRCPVCGRQMPSNKDKRVKRNDVLVQRNLFGEQVDVPVTICMDCHQGGRLQAWYIARCIGPTAMVV